MTAKERKYQVETEEHEPDQQEVYLLAQRRNYEESVELSENPANFDENEIKEKRKYKKKRQRPIKRRKKFQTFFNKNGYYSISESVAVRDWVYFYIESRSTLSDVLSEIGITPIKLIYFLEYQLKRRSYFPVPDLNLNRKQREILTREFEVRYLRLNVPIHLDRDFRSEIYRLLKVFTSEWINAITDVFKFDNESVQVPKIERPKSSRNSPKSNYKATLPKYFPRKPKALAINQSDSLSTDTQIQNQRRPRKSSFNALRKSRKIWES